MVEDEHRRPRARPCRWAIASTETWFVRHETVLKPSRAIDNESMT